MAGLNESLFVRHLVSARPAPFPGSSVRECDVSGRNLITVGRLASLKGGSRVAQGMRQQRDGTENREGRGGGFLRIPLFGNRSH